jgi:molybdenum cofactor cytidylyltransferase
MSKIAGAILAAGFSRRYGADKLLQRVGGKTILERSMAAITDLDYKSVVLRPGDPKRALAPKDFAVLVNSNASQGLSSSIRLAASWTPWDSEALLLVLGDQPLSKLVTPKLVKEFRAGDYLGATAYYAGTPVNPTIFSRDIIHELLLLDGDSGAKKVVLKYLDRFRRVEVDEDVILDCDTPDVLERLAQALARHQL